MTSLSQKDTPYLDYRVPWRPGEMRPGRHPARHAGTGGDPRTCRPFWQLPDARRIDVRRSILHPSGDIMVRQTQHRASITVALAVDVSRSMAPGPGRSVMAALARLADAASRAALRGGDAFTLLPYDRTVREKLVLPPTHARSIVAEAARSLSHVLPDARGAEGLFDLAHHLPSRRCLLLLASDFLMPIELLDRALSSLSRHDLAPVVLHPDDPDGLPHAGLLRLRDSETGATRLVVMRPALHRRWRAASLARRRILDEVFLRHGRPGFHARPLHAGEPLDIDALSQHLLAC